MRQGLLAIVVDGVEKLPEQQRPPKDMLLEWIGVTLQNYENFYTQYRKAISDLATFYNSHGLKMMVLKGYACSLDWPKPAHRPCGDIDIWQFGEYKSADELLSQEQAVKIDNSHGHHTVFYWHDFMVENHYDFVDIHHRISSPRLEKIFKELGKDDSHFVDAMSTSTGLAAKVYLPSPNLHALFLLRHMIEHFASSDISLRYLLDWGFHIEKHGSEIDWAWLKGVIEEFGMTPAYNIFNGICVDDLGFDASLFPVVHFIPDLKDRVLADIISPSFTGAEPKAFLPRLVFKWQRWRANIWKHDICYNDSLWSAFWSSLLGHILKPASI